MTDALPRALAEIRQFRQGGIALQYLRRRAAEPNERGWVDAVSQVEAKRSDWSSIADAKARGMHGVIEVLEVALVKAERYVAERAEDVAHVMKEDALNVVADERKSQLDIVKEERVSPERKTGRLRCRATWCQRSSGVARSGLVKGESAERVGAASEEALRQRNRFLLGKPGGRRKRSDDAELRLAGQSEITREAVIGRVAQQGAAEAALGAEKSAGETDVGGVVNAPMRVGGTVAPILREVSR